MNLVSHVAVDALAQLRAAGVVGVFLTGELQLGPPPGHDVGGNRVGQTEGDEPTLVLVLVASLGCAAVAWLCYAVSRRLWLSREVRRLAERRDALRDEVGVLEKVGEAKRCRDALRDEVGKLKRRRDSLLNRVRMLDEQDVESRLERLERLDIDELEHLDFDELGGLSGRIEELESRINDLKRLDIDELSGRINELDSRIDDLEYRLPEC